MTSTVVVARAIDTTGTEQWMTVEVPGAGDPGYYTILRTDQHPGRYSIRMQPEGLLGYVEPGTKPPGEITDIFTDGIPVRRGVRS